MSWLVAVVLIAQAGEPPAPAAGPVAAPAAAGDEGAPAPTAPAGARATGPAGGQERLPPAPEEDVDELFRLARNEFIHGQYELAIAHLNSLIYPIRLGREDDLVEARRLLGISYYLTQRYGLATEELTKLLYTRPEYQLDPFFVAPPIIEFFEKLRARLKPQLDALLAVRQERQAERERRRGDGQPGLLQVERINYYHRSALVVWLPFGLGQYQNGDDGLGHLFLAAQAAALAGNIATALAWQVRRPASGSDEHRGLVIANLGAAALFGALWLAGSLQAFMDFEPISVESSTQRVPLPREGAP